MLILAIRTPDEKEFHVHYEGHENLESAKFEITYIREKLLLDKKKPFDCYVYEADKPLYGYKLYKLDEIDFNFYEEQSEEEIQKSIDEFNRAAAQIRELAKKEQKQFGGKKVV